LNPEKTSHKERFRHNIGKIETDYDLGHYYSHPEYYRAMSKPEIELILPESTLINFPVPKDVLQIPDEIKNKYFQHDKPSTVHYLSDNTESISLKDDLINNNKHLAEKLLSEALPFLFVNIGKCNSNKLNDLVNCYPEVKIFGLSEVRLSEGYIKSGKIVPAGFFMMHGEYDKTKKFYSCFLIAKEYESKTEQIKNLGSFCTIKINIGRSPIFLTSIYRHNSGSELFNKGYNEGVEDKNLQNSLFLKWLNLALKNGGFSKSRGRG
jgi:hypothetical protein